MDIPNGEILTILKLPVPETQANIDYVKDIRYEFPTSIQQSVQNIIYRIKVISL